MNEFEFLKNLKQHFNFDLTGDDCAVLPFGDTEDLLVTSDLLIEEIDFRLAWSEPYKIGHKALAVSLSDIAAMAGAAKWAFLSLGIPKQLWNEEFLMSFYSGLNTLADRFGVRIAGGDISLSNHEFVIDSIVAGSCPKGRAVMRSGALPGQSIWVSGPLGGAAGGLRLLEAGTENPGLSPGAAAELIDHQLKPLPQLNTANLLQEQQLASAMIDISDGLSSDLRHICEASGVGAVIRAEAIPINPHLDGLEPKVLAPFTNPFEAALHGGEDFELLFTADRERAPELEGAGCTEIGETVEDPEVFDLEMSGKRSRLEPRGYVHFSKAER